MKSNIFMPNTIKVGYQERESTYTGKLAYIIYYDEKGTLRKETSWNSWRDLSIEPQEFKNEPTSGFVLNKKAGGYSTGWNHRQTYVRVYDPRGFEFEITIPNLLYILENTSSIKGKGLEGEFVYGWDGTELILVPVSSPDYKDMAEYNRIVHANRKFKIKDMIPGATYLTKDNKEIIYVGRFPRYDWNGEKYKSNYYYFRYANNRGWEIISSLAKVIDVISEEPVDNYADIRDAVEHITDFSPVDPEMDEYKPYTLEELKRALNDRSWLYCYNENGKKMEIQYKRPYKNGEYTSDKEKYIIKGSGSSYPSLMLNVIGEFDTLDELYEEFEPHYKNEYLANGNFCRSDKRDVK